MPEKVLRTEAERRRLLKRAAKWLVAAAMLALFGWYCFAASPNGARYSHIASLLAGKPVTVHCDGRLLWAYNRWRTLQISAGEQGFAQIGGNQAYLSPGICSELDSLVANPTLRHGGALLKEERAVLVLAHESMHLAGEASESAADCEAGHAAAKTAVALGFSSESADTLAVFIRSDLEQNSFGLPDAYLVPSDCFS